LILEIIAIIILYATSFSLNREHNLILICERQIEVFGSFYNISLTQRFLKYVLTRHPLPSFRTRFPISRNVWQLVKLRHCGNKSERQTTWPQIFRTHVTTYWTFIFSVPCVFLSLGAAPKWKIPLRIRNLPYIIYLKHPPVFSLIKSRLFARNCPIKWRISSSAAPTIPIKLHISIKNGSVSAVHQYKLFAECIVHVKGAS
jgi:hypothetical protein